MPDGGGTPVPKFGGGGQDVSNDDEVFFGTGI